MEKTKKIYSSKDPLVTNDLTCPYCHKPIAGVHEHLGDTVCKNCHLHIHIERRMIAEYYVWPIADDTEAETEKYKAKWVRRLQCMSSSQREALLYAIYEVCNLPPSNVDAIQDCK